MEPVRGLVMELINNKTCIILTGDGRFLKVPIPRCGAIVGQEITINDNVLRTIRPYLAAASLLAVVMAWFVFEMIFSGAAAAYVVLDINPGIQLGVNGKKEIVNARGLDESGEHLLEHLDVVDKPLDQGLAEIFDEAVRNDYLKPENKQVVLATVVQNKQTSVISVIKSQGNMVVTEEIRGIVRDSFDKTDVRAELVLAETDLETMKKADKVGISTGRYLLQAGALKNGVKITDSELREKQIKELEKEKNFKSANIMQITVPARDQKVNKGNAAQENKTVKERGRSNDNKPNDKVTSSGKNEDKKKPSKKTQVIEKYVGSPNPFADNQIPAQTEKRNDRQTNAKPVKRESKDIIKGKDKHKEKDDNKNNNKCNNNPGENGNNRTKPEKKEYKGGVKG